MSQVSSWAVAAFLATYMLGFIYPTFLSQPSMRFVRTVPVLDPIGVDLKIAADYSRAWRTATLTDYQGDRPLYPPLVTVLYAPLSMLDHASAYATMTVTTTGCFVANALWFPVAAGRGPATPLLLMLAVAGLTSYGLQFELERGQFNVIAMALCSFATWLFHARPTCRYLAYFLFVVSVQLKVYPLIFALLLVDDWGAFRRNVFRWSALAIASVAAMFILGASRFAIFAGDVSAATASPFIWTGNHSVRSFVAGGVEHGWLDAGRAPLAELALLLATAACLLTAVLRASRRNAGGIDPELLLACTAAALLVPAVSHDYTLPILAGPIAIVLTAAGHESSEFSNRHLATAMAALVAAAYAATMFSFNVKPPVLDNNLPFLMVILVGAAALSVLRDASPRAVTAAGS